MSTTTFRTFPDDLKKNDGHSNSYILLYFLIAIDMGFIILHCVYGSWHYLHGTMDQVNRMFLLTEDKSYSEYFQYAKEIGLALLLTIAGFKRRKLLFFAWALLFFYLFYDDCFSFHELAGHKIAKYLDFQPVFNLRKDDLGELFISASAGILIFGLIIISTFRTWAYVKLSIDLFILMGFLIFFGVGFDMLHVIIDNNAAGYVFGIIEDGGEMIVLSVMLAYITLVFDQLKSEDNKFKSPFEIFHNLIRSISLKIFNKSFY